MPWILLLFYLYISFPLLSQTLIFEKDISSDKVKHVSKDRKGHIYYSDAKGNIKKYNLEGAFLHVFSPQKAGNLTLIESWPTLRTFAFYKDLQEYLYLDRFLIAGPRFRLDNESIGFAGVVTISGDNGLWIIDESDFNLKKLDLNFNEIVINTSLNLGAPSSYLDINFMKEYQNKLFINDRNSGILVFDNLGNFIRKLPFSGVEYFNFTGDELYFIKDSKLHFYHLYNFKERNIALPDGKKFKFSLVLNNKVILFTEATAEIYRLDR